MSDLALIDQPHSIDVSHWAEVLTFAARMADAVCDTEFVPGALRGKREAVAATIMYGAEVGVTPMQALAGIHIVDGRPQPSAELMRAMILRAGHSITVHEMSGTRARVSGLRRGRPESERVDVVWTTDQARAAGLLGRPNWRNYPRAMLVARASGDLARILFPDVVKGLGYVAEDDPEVLDSWAPAASAVREPDAPARKPLQRRKRSVADTPVQTAELAPEVLGPEVDKVTTDRWLTDDEAEVRERDVAAEARAAVEAALVEPDAAAPANPDDKPSDPPPTDVDVPLPDELQPVGTGRPAPVAPVPTLPDVEPEAPEPEGRHEPPKVGVRPLKAIQTMLTRELGTVASPEERHALLAAIVGHPVASSKDLLRHEGYRVLDYGDRFADGSAAWEFTDGGLPIVVVDTREPPEETPN